MSNTCPRHPARWNSTLQEPSGFSVGANIPTVAETSGSTPLRKTFVTVTSHGGKRTGLTDMKNYYYISTGDLEGFYTLKHRFDEIRYYKGEGYESTGAVESYIVENDTFIKNLSTDKAKALSSANEWCDRNGIPVSRRKFDADFDLNEIRRISREQAEARRIAEEQRIATTDWSILPFGKHAGESLHNLIKIDFHYVEFVSKWDSGDGKYCAAIARELCAPIWADQAKQKETANSRLVGIFGKDALESWANGHDFASKIARSILQGEEVRDRGLAIFCEIIASEKGRRNSKKWVAAYESLASKIWN